MSLSRSRLCTILFALVASWQLATQSSAHEFWLDPVEFTPKPGATVPIVHRIGQNFLGDTYPFVRSLSRRFSVVDQRGERSIKVIDGDDPAAEVRFATPGLSIIVYQRIAESITFKTWEQFEENLKYEGLEWVIDAHRRTAKPMKDIRELYARCAKSLLQVGTEVSGSDRPVGLPLEIITERNPYSLAPGAKLPVRVLHQGKPITGILVKSFNVADKQGPRLARTDADGRVEVEVPEPGEVLISAVHMLHPARGEPAEWSSLWASLTFKRP